LNRFGIVEKFSIENFRLKISAPIASKHRVPRSSAIVLTRRARPTLA
jgi:hypothetical protein